MNILKSLEMHLYQYWQFSEESCEDCVQISTTSNPGWLVRIRVDNTPLVNKEIPYNMRELEDNKWIGFSVTNNEFQGSGDPTQLINIIQSFKNLLNETIDEAPLIFPNSALLENLMSWFQERINGVWETEHYILIRALEYPGWGIYASLSGLSSANATYDTGYVENENAEQPDWYQCSIGEEHFEGMADYSKLEFLLEQFQAHR